jgi:hypothetical protein
MKPTCCRREGGSYYKIEQNCFKNALHHIVAVHKFGDNWEPPSHGSTSCGLQTEYYRPTDFVINFGKAEVVYSFGRADSVTPRRIDMSWAPNA